jgi:hypothetical protein
MPGKRKGYGSTDQKPKPRFYVNDRVARYDISRPSYPCLIVDPKDLHRTIGKLERIQNELQPRVTTDTSEHISSLTLRIVLEYEDNSEDPATYTAVVRLSARAFSDMTLSSLTNDELSTYGLSQFEQDNNIFYALHVTSIQSILICAECLFCDVLGAGKFKEVADLFRDMTDICLFIKGSDVTKTGSPSSVGKRAC